MGWTQGALSLTSFLMSHCAQCSHIMCNWRSNIWITSHFWKFCQIWQMSKFTSRFSVAWSRAVAVLAIIASWTSMKPYSYANTSRQEMWRRWWWCSTVSLSTNVRLHHAYIPHWSLKPYFKYTTNPSPARLWSELFVNVKCSGWWHRLYEEVAVVL